MTCCTSATILMFIFVCFNSESDSIVSIAQLNLILVTIMKSHSTSLLITEQETFIDALLK